jgi:hypothetical protein
MFVDHITITGTVEKLKTLYSINFVYAQCKNTKHRFILKSGLNSYFQ